jgi:predicted flap endonuclease-1-like 5' DNA nuclease
MDGFKFREISPNKAFKKMQRILKRQNEIVEPQPYTTTKDVIECEHYQIKDSRIKELEDALRKTTQLRPANQFSGGKDDNIKHLAKEFPDQVQEIQGIGPTTVRKLNGAGIVTVMDLAVSRPDELAVAINVSKESTAALIMATQKLIRDSRIIEKEFLTADFR